jgi:CheY-like chemotaxis protein
MPTKSLPSDLLASLQQLRTGGAAATARLSDAIRNDSITGAWVPRLMAALGAMEGLLATALDGISAGSRKGRVLIVDDQPSNRQMLRKLLENSGYDVVEAESLKSAIAHLDASRYLALVTDIHLSDGNGLDLLAHGKNALNIKGQPLPMVATSADSDPRIVEAVLNAGAAWVHKNDIIGDLPRALSRLLAGETPTSDVVDRTKFEAVSDLVTAAGARVLVDRYIDDASKEIGKLSSTRGSVEAWRETCHAIHGTTVLLGATRMRERLSELLGKPDTELEAGMVDNERWLRDELNDVRAFYSMASDAD